MRVALALLFALARPAAAREVRTGATTVVGTDGGQLYSAIYWVEPRGDADVEIVALPTATEIGSELDVIDERGFVARVRVFELEAAVCGALSYSRARAHATWPGFRRDLVGAVVALGPARGHPARGRVVPSEEILERRAGRTMIDVDGDGIPDLARQVSLECAAEKGHTLACLETWAREARGWRRLARAEIGPCG